MPKDLLTFLALIAFVPVLIAFLTFLSVWMMQRTPDLLPAPELLPTISAALPKEYGAFLEAHDFVLAGTYRFQQVSLGLWTRGEKAPFQCFVFAQTQTQKSFEFVTEFSDTDSLTTTKSRSSFLLPRPKGAFLQSFPSVGIEQLWAMHTQGEEFLLSNSIVSPAECRLTFPERFRRGVVEQLTLIKSLPLWPIRGIYWYLIKRFLLQNRPIWKQDIGAMYQPVAERSYPS